MFNPILQYELSKKKAMPSSTLLNGITNYFNFNNAIVDGSLVSTKDLLTSEVMNLNGAAFTTGKFNSAIDVQTGDYPRTIGTSSFNFTKAVPFTLSFWYKQGSEFDTRLLFSKELISPDLKGYEVYLNGGDMLLSFLGRGIPYMINNRYSAGISSNGTWYNIVLTYDGSGSAFGVSLYVNASVKTRTVLKNTLGAYDFNNSIPFTFGAYHNNTLPSSGVMDELACWNRVLSSDEITELYNGGVGKQYPF